MAEKSLPLRCVRGLTSHGRWPLIKRSVYHALRPTETGGVHPKKSCTMDEGIVTHREEDMVEVYHRSLNVIVAIVRPLLFALTTHLTWSLTARRFCISSPVQS